MIARSDWEYVFNTFAFGYKIGYHFIATEAGAWYANDGWNCDIMSWSNGNFVGIGADDMYEAAVLVDASQPYGILITNGEFTAFDGMQKMQSLWVYFICIAEYLFIFVISRQL